ncbi:microcephalin [Asbolus verrucosus]|uniref:Microcephalin n=1 Tax=Asbolus verrucosus TaxID=1661398 RepID=A0A482VU83_ASBVE|nr:microcephalin [Asbolus verrucosus]
MSSISSQIPSADLMEALLKDPVKKAMLLQLIAQEKDGFEAYKRKEQRKSNNITPLKKLQRLHCESPTALQRRRALEKLHQDTTSESSSSELSEVATEVKGPKLPFEQLLKGVRAYVEVRRNDTDRSEGIKAVMKLMGATIRDQFTSDVTHVIFKDGSFTTYQKAKLMKIHLVSVLWLDAVRRNNARVPEKNYPAFGSKVCDENVSILCSQLQKDYEDIITDEKRRSLSALPEPHHKSLNKNRRRTMMTPQTSMSSYVTAQKSSRLLLSDDEVVQITSARDSNSPDLTSDDSDCGVIDGQTSKRSRDGLDLLQLSPQMTDDAGKSFGRNSSFFESGSESLINRVKNNNQRKTIHVITNMEITPNIESRSIRPKSGCVDKVTKILQNSTIQSIMTSSCNSDLTKSGLDKIEISSADSSDRTKSGLDRLAITRNSDSKNKENCSLTETTMSSLRLSDSFDKNKEKTVPNRDKSSAKVARGQTSSDTGSEEEKSSETSKERSVLKAGAGDAKKTGRRTNKPSLISSKSESEDGGETDNEPKGTRKNKRLLSASSSRSELENSTETDKKTKKKHGRSRNNDQDTDDVTSSRKSGRTSAERNKRLSSVSSNRSEGRRVNSGKSVTPRSSPTQPQTNPSPPKKSRAENSSSKKTRKLFNPNEERFISPSQDDKERDDYLKQKAKKCPDDVFINPNNVLITPLQTQNKSRNASLEHINWSSDESEKQKEKKKKKKAKNDTPAIRDSSADEQKDLLNLLTRKIDDDIQKRRSKRLSLSQANPKYHFTSSSSDSQSTNSLPITPIKRRSTLDFQTVSQTQQKRKLKLDPKRTSSIVCTKMHRHEVISFENTVRDLGMFFVEDQVSDKTTHLVAGESKRTINMLRAVARGCWILKPEWQCRLQRQAFGPKYSMDIFRDCGFIYVAKSTTPKQADLKELISICQGRVTGVYRNAAVVVGEYVRGEGVPCVTEAWVLDSITFNKLKPFKKYLIKSAGSESPQF